MINKKLISTAALIFTIGMLIVGCSKGDSNNKSKDVNVGGKVKITYGSTEQSNMATGLASQWFTDEVNSRSNGEIEISYHPQGTLGTDADLTQQVMSGNIPMASVSIGNYICFGIFAGSSNVGS